MTTSAETEARAADWLARRDRGSDSDAEFEAWLAESAGNRVAYLRLESAWRRADRLASLRAPAQPMMLRPQERPRTPILARIAAGLVVSAIAGGVLTWLVSQGTAPTVYATGVGGRETVALADGSQVDLSTSTTLRARVGGAQRVVWLDSGEAYFSVAHDRTHPFVIWSGGRSVTVVGTKFAVRRDGDRLAVTVEEGRVTVRDEHADAAILTAGDTVDVTGSSFVRGHDTPNELAAALSWRQGLLAFDQATLADAVAEFNRYNRVKLLVADSKAARLRIGGTFAYSNVNGFLRLLGKAFGLHETTRGDTVIISS